MVVRKLRCNSIMIPLKMASCKKTLLCRGLQIDDAAHNKVMSDLLS